jgi:hypothetical protein
VRSEVLILQALTAGQPTIGFWLISRRYAGATLKAQNGRFGPLGQAKIGNVEGRLGRKKRAARHL